MSMNLLLLVSFLLAPHTKSADGFFKGFAENGSPPSLWTLVLSQVTTWIFARSLMNAAILGYYYGIAGERSACRPTTALSRPGTACCRARHPAFCGSAPDA